MAFGLVPLVAMAHGAMMPLLTVGAVPRATISLVPSLFWIASTMRVPLTRPLPPRTSWLNASAIVLAAVAELSMASMPPPAAVRVPSEAGATPAASESA